MLDQWEKYLIIGQSISEYSLFADEEGWYMIGGTTLPAQFSVDICNIIVIYGYSPEVGYQRILGFENLETGKGCWIKFNGISDRCELRVEVTGF